MTGTLSSCRREHLICLPHPGEDAGLSVAGEFTAWHAEAGETVAAGKLLYQVTWAGVVIDYVADRAGILERLFPSLRQTVHPGEAICVITAVEASLERDQAEHPGQQAVTTHRDPSREPVGPRSHS